MFVESCGDHDVCADPPRLEAAARFALHGAAVYHEHAQPREQGTGLRHGGEIVLGDAQSLAGIFSSFVRGVGKRRLTWRFRRSIHAVDSTTIQLVDS